MPNVMNYFFMNYSIICDALRDLEPFVQFKNREKHPWRSATFSAEACNFTKSNTRPRFLNCTNCTKSRSFLFAKTNNFQFIGIYIFQFMFLNPTVELLNNFSIL